jgi:hypothetical protein
MDSFKYYLLNEARVQLGQRVGDILNAVNDLEQNMDSMGTRQQVKNAELIANQIRRILHSNWREQEKEHLEDLQKIGVAILKAIEEKDDLKGILNSVKSELENISGGLGTPVQQLNKPEDGKEQQGDEQESPEPAPPMEQPPQEQQPQQQPQMPQPPMGQPMGQPPMPAAPSMGGMPGMM